MCFTEGEGHEPDYEHGKGRVISYDAVPRLKALVASLPSYFGDKSRGLKAEANYYYDITLEKLKKR